jgi:hypothetical protein
MNQKQIEQLATRAGYQKDMFGVGHWDMPEFQKFAELIVRECAGVAFQFSAENKRIHPEVDVKTMPVATQVAYHSTCQSVGHEIKEYFGVKE